MFMGVLESKIFLLNTLASFPSVNSPIIAHFKSHLSKTSKISFSSLGVTANNIRS